MQFIPNLATSHSVPLLFQAMYWYYSTCASGCTLPSMRLSVCCSTFELVSSHMFTLFTCWWLRHSVTFSTSSHNEQKKSELIIRFSKTNVLYSRVQFTVIYNVESSCRTLMHQQLKLVSPVNASSTAKKEKQIVFLKYFVQTIKKRSPLCDPVTVCSGVVFTSSIHEHKPTHLTSFQTLSST